MSNFFLPLLAPLTIGAGYYNLFAIYILLDTHIVRSYCNKIHCIVSEQNIIVVDGSDVSQRLGEFVWYGHGVTRDSTGSKTRRMLRNSSCLTPDISSDYTHIAQKPSLQTSETSIVSTDRRLQGLFIRSCQGLRTTTICASNHALFTPNQGASNTDIGEPLIAL